MSPPTTVIKTPTAAPTDFRPFQPGNDGNLTPKGGVDSKPIFAAKGGNAKAKDDPTDKSPKLEELIPSLTDEALFGIFLSKYQAERNTKFLNVTLAIVAVKKYLGGDATQSSVAKEKIIAWLSDPELLPKTTPAHQARVNMIAVLSKAKNDAGVAEILGALQANYSTGVAASPSPQPSGKTGEDLLPALEDKTLFSDQYDAYAKEKTKKYLNLTLSILALRRFLKGETDQLAVAKEKIVAWRSDTSLLQDPVAIKAGRGMKAIFDTPVQDKDMGDGLKELRKVLVADYSPKDSPPEVKPVILDPPPVGGMLLKTPLVFSFTSPGKVGSRSDTPNNITGKFGPAVKPPYQKVLNQYSDFTMKAEMLLTVDNATGFLKSVSFDNLKINGSAPSSAVQKMLENIATRLFSTVSFAKNGTDSTFQVKASLNLIGS